MPVPHPLPEPLVDALAERFRALGDPMRIRLVDALRDGPATIAQLTARCGTTPQNISKHLAILRGTGVLRRTREGTIVRFEIADPAVLGLCEQVCGSLERATAERLAHLRA